VRGCAGAVDPWFGKKLAFRLPVCPDHPNPNMRYERVGVELVETPNESRVAVESRP
jgi:hypothetical protein